MTTEESQEEAGRTSGVFHAQPSLYERVESLEGSRRTFTWLVGLGAPALFGAFFIVALWLVDKVQASAERAGEQTATIRSLEKSIGTLDQDVRELRARILKLSAVDPGAGVVATGVP